MKTKLFALWVLAAAVSLGGLVGCIKDAAIDDPDNGWTSGENGEHSYLAFRISAVGAGTATRADASGSDFQGEDDVEKAVVNAMLFLFDASGNYMRHDIIDEQDALTGILDPQQTVVFEFSAIPVGGANANTPIAFAVVVLNGDATLAETAASSTLWGFVSETRAQTSAENIYYTSGNKTYLTMTNSVWVTPADPDKQITGMPGENIIRYAEPLYVNDFKTDRSEAEQAANAVKIAVEPLAVKAEVAFTGTGINDPFTASNDGNNVVYYEVSKGDATADGADISKFLAYFDPSAEASPYTSIGYGVRIAGWGLNAVAKKESRVKMYSAAQYGSAAPLSTLVKDSEIATKLGTWYNAPDKSRSYWAVTPHYFSQTTDYPTNSRGNSQVASAPVQYFSYDSFKPLASDGTENTEAKSAALDVAKRTRYQYCSENTFGGDLLAGDTYKLAATSVLFPAQLLLDIPLTDAAKAVLKAAPYNKSDDELAEATEMDLPELIGRTDADQSVWWSCVGDKFRYNGNIMSTYGYFYSAVNNFANALIDHIIATNTEITPEKFRSLTISYNGKAAYKYAVADEGGVTIEMFGDGYNWSTVTKANANTQITPANLWFTVNKTANKDAVVEIAYDAAKVQAITYSYSYDKESAGVWTTETVTSQALDAENAATLIAGLGKLEAEYFNSGRMYYSQPITHYTSGTSTEEEKQPLAKYGVVRNHWYKMTVNAVNSVGIPVGDPTEEIVPNYDPKLLYLGVSVDILEWHKIDQNVTL